MEKMDNVIILNHPLLQHKISMLRDKNTGTNEFRKLVDEIAMLEGFIALEDLPLEDVEVETPIEKCMTPKIAGRKLAVVPILRAGLGMVSGILALVPTAKVGHIGLYRDEVTHEPHEYYCKLPSPIEERTIVVVDPMLATGASIVLTHRALVEKAGMPQRTIIASVIASEEGLEYTKKHFSAQNTTIWCGTVDAELTVKSYIVPGIGDAGDLAYGDKM